jgi:hypothetical protein
MLDKSPTQKIATESLIKIATARCARISYTVVEQEPVKTNCFDKNNVEIFEGEKVSLSFETIKLNGIAKLIKNEWCLYQDEGNFVGLLHNKNYITVKKEDKQPDYEKDIELHDRLATSGHWSPMEHCAKAMSKTEYLTNLSGVAKDGLQSFEEPFAENAIIMEDDYNSDIKGWSGNFRGFIQYRKTFTNENITK